MDYTGCEAARPLPRPKSLIAWETAFTRSITFVVCCYSLFCKNSHLFLVLLLDPLALLLMEFVWMPPPYLQSVHSARSFKVTVLGFSHTSCLILPLTTSVWLSLTSWWQRRQPMLFSPRAGRQQWLHHQNLGTECPQVQCYTCTLRGSPRSQMKVK